MNCNRCPDYMTHQGEAWETTPCAKCQLRDDSYGTLPYVESCTANSSRDDNPDDEIWDQEAADSQSPQPYALLDGEDPDDPRLPLSTLVSALALLMSVQLPGRRALQLRVQQQMPYSKIALRLGITRQGVEKLIAQAIAKQPLLGNLLPGKSGRAPAPIRPTHTSVVAEHDSSSQKCIKSLHKPRFAPRSATRDSA
jgi:hypothetical protein